MTIRQVPPLPRFRRRILPPDINDLLVFFQVHRVLPVPFPLMVHFIMVDELVEIVLS
jgi:hypothetical protein